MNPLCSERLALGLAPVRSVGLCSGVLDASGRATIRFSAALGMELQSIEFVKSYGVSTTDFVAPGGRHSGLAECGDSGDISMRSDTTKMNLPQKGPPQMRKRPVQQRSNLTVETILASVEQILEREGAERLTTSHVAERAGFSVGTVYQYFPDKRAMLSALADCGQQRAQDEMHAEASRAAPCSLETVARIVVRGTLRCNSDFADKVRAMIISRFDRREFDHVKERHDIFADFIHGVLNEFAAKEIRPLSQEACFILVSALLGPIQCAFLADPAHAWSPKFEDELVHLFVTYTSASG